MSEYSYLAERLRLRTELHFSMHSLLSQPDETCREAANWPDKSPSQLRSRIAELEVALKLFTQLDCKVTEKRGIIYAPSHMS